jgi:hypothetical protein
MTLEEINNIEDKAERLKLLKQFMKERQDEQTRQNESDASYDPPLRDEAGGMMSTAMKKSG